MAVNNPTKAAVKALATLSHDRDNWLLKIDRYERGDQDKPFIPDGADAEYRLHAERCITNVIPFILGTPAQMLYADSFRRGRKSTDSTEDKAGKELEARGRAMQPEWDHFQKSRMDQKQSGVYRGALKFGHSFVLTEKDEKSGDVLSRGLSALNTVALYDDPTLDADADFTLTVRRWPAPEQEKVGLAWAWDDTYRYPVTFESLDDAKSIHVGAGSRHGAQVNPVTRFTAAVDLEGRTCGVVEPMFAIQDRINQTVFDLLVVQSYASFKVRTIAGMVPPYKMVALDAEGNEIPNPESRPDEVVDWRPMIDPKTGRAVVEQVQVNARRLLMAKDHETRFGTLDETPLDGFISAIELGFRHMAALSQTPPHHILGEISNLSAEALDAAERALTRKVDEFKASFGESWERVFRVANQIGGWETGTDDYSGETLWRDTGNLAVAQAADAFGKVAEQLGVPARALWDELPGMTANKLAYWEELREKEDASGALADSARRNVAGSNFRLSAVPRDASASAEAGQAA